MIFEENYFKFFFDFYYNRETIKQIFILMHFISPKIL